MAAEETDLVVITTANQLRKEIKSQLNEALAEALPEVCSSGSYSVQNSSGNDIVGAVTQEMKEVIKDCINDTITDLLAPLLSQLTRLLTPGLTPSHPATSCMEILQLAPQSPSGLYWIRANEHSARHMYCDMERSCKGVAGGWMRVASIDMTDSKSTCPPGLRTVERSSKPNRLCAMSASGPSCSSTVFPLQGVQYSRVCGKIIGYQSGSPDAFNRFISGQNTLESNYVDGISLTHGVKPYKHIWTFAAAVHEHNSAPKFVCPCTNTRNRPPPSVPSFVGQNYFCDTGSTAHFRFVFYGDDPLWDGAGCGQFSTCCAFNSPPWFMREVSPTTDDIMMRLCTDQKQGDEDMNFETLEIYVQ
jgi:dynein heavy chain